MGPGNNSDKQSGSLHQTLGETGFANGANYEAGRPGYCDDAIDFLAAGLDLRAGRRVLDLGAGTGKLTGQLLPFGATLVAVEPSASMREQFHHELPDVEILDGTGEAIPIENNSLDAVVVAQAFHWFEPRRALSEIARVLRPSRSLALVWNERNETVEWVRQLSEVMQWTTRQPYIVGTDYRPIVTSSGRFVRARRERFDFSDPMDHHRLRQRVLSTSYIAASTVAEREAIMRVVDPFIDALPDVVQMPYVADCYLFDLAESR